MNDEISCLVCGQKSHRSDWQKMKSPACDSHSKEEIAKATAPALAVVMPPAPVTPPPAVPPVVPAK